MNIFDLTSKQLKRAAAIKDQIDRLNRELRKLVGQSTPVQRRPGKKRTMSAAAKRKIAAAQRARWAKIRRA